MMRDVEIFLIVFYNNMRIDTDTFWLNEGTNYSKPDEQTKIGENLYF